MKEKDLQMSIKIGDDERYHINHISIVTFQRDSGSSLTLKYFMYVMVLKKNLVSVAILEDRCYDVIFCKGKVFLHHIALGKVN